MSTSEVPSNYLCKGIIVVIVTYGDRRALLQQVLDALPGQCVDRVVVVDNGARWPVKDELAAVYGDFVDVVEMGANTGSAKGFATGIQRALNLGAEYIWLLDDDNCPRNGTLALLHEAYDKASASTPRDRLAVVAFRPEQLTALTLGMATNRINPRINSFHGFHLRDIPYKLWRRTPWGKPRMRNILPSTTHLNVAPYSGLMFHRDLIHAIGLPNQDFILYADDYDFTYRIIRQGGKILLLTSAVLDDQELSWNATTKFGIGFVGMIKGEGDFRAFYEMRNRIYFDATCLKRSSCVFGMNRAIYMGILFVLAHALQKKERLWLLRQAVDDGLAGRLGMNKKHPL